MNEDRIPPALPTETMMAAATPFLSEPPELLVPHDTTIGISGYPPAAARKRPAYWALGLVVAMRSRKPMMATAEQTMAQIARLWIRSDIYPPRQVVTAATTYGGTDIYKVSEKL